MDFLILLRNIVLATLPGLFWLWWYVRQDDREPEPKQFLWRVFLLGALATIPALFLEFTIDLFIPFSGSGVNWATVTGAFLIVAPLEELAKFLVVWAGVYRHRVFNERMDGVTYMVVSALGFATIENILVVLSDGAGILPLRFVTATLLHALASGLVGYFLGAAKFSRQRAGILITSGLILGTLLHGVYDYIAILDSDIRLSIILLLLAIMYLVLDNFVRRSKVRDQQNPLPRRTRHLSRAP